MPDALIVVKRNSGDPWQSVSALKEMVRIGLIKVVSVKGVLVYGRPYLTNRAIRLAYQKKTKGVSQFKRYINS